MAADALLALIDSHHQSLATQLKLRHAALEHTLQCARKAKKVPAPALLASAAQCGWNAAWQLLQAPAARGTFVAQLSELCSICNEYSLPNSKLQADLNALLSMCLIYTGQSQAAFDQSGHALSATLSEGQSQLRAWRIKAAAAVGDIDQEAAMTRVGSLSSDAQAAAWLTLAQSSRTELGQQAALQQCLHAASGKPTLLATCHMQWAEWLLRVDVSMARREAALDALMYAFKLLTSQHVSLAAQAPATVQSGASNNVQVMHKQQHDQWSLNVVNLALLVRVALIRALASIDGLERLDWLRAAQHYAVQTLHTLAGSPEQSSVSRSVADSTGHPVGDTSSQCNSQLPQQPHMWLEYTMTSEELHALVSTRMAQMSRYESLQQQLDVLIAQLQQFFCPLEALPIRWLQIVLAQTHQQTSDRSARLLHLAADLTELSAHTTAQNVVDLAGLLYCMLYLSYGSEVCCMCSRHLPAVWWQLVRLSESLQCAQHTVGTDTDVWHRRWYAWHDRRCSAAKSRRDTAVAGNKQRSCSIHQRSHSSKAANGYSRWRRC